MSDRGSGWDPRRLAFHVLSVLAVVVCVVAAAWQWDRATRTEADAVPDDPIVALADLDPTEAYSGMRVRIDGTFDPDHEALVAPRPRAGQDGAWVLTPLLPSADGDAGAGQPAAAAIVRGWIPAGTSPAPPPSGPVSVVGVLVADSRQPGAAAQGEPPTLDRVDTGALEALAGYPVRTGWFALADLQPAGSGQPLPLLVTELPGAEVGLNWRNAAYALQWIVFAGFVAFFWNRFRREYVQRPVEQEMPR
jgi:cytochrome oxidase assembly protein ShyY1